MGAFCNDCGADTEPWPPHKGSQEHYILRDEIWRQAGMTPGKVDADFVLEGGGILCVGCVEKRLGRLLTESDFEPHTLGILKEGCQSTPRLLSRVGIAFMNVAHWPLPDDIVESWAEEVLKSALNDDLFQLRQMGVSKLQKVNIDLNEGSVTLVTVDKTDPEGFSTIKYRIGPNLKDFIASCAETRPERGKSTCLHGKNRPGRSRDYLKKSAMTEKYEDDPEFRKGRQEAHALGAKNGAPTTSTSCSRQSTATRSMSE